MADLAISSRQDLAELLGDNDDTAITAWAVRIGVADVIERAFVALLNRSRSGSAVDPDAAVDPDSAADPDAAVRWDIATPTDPDAAVWWDIATPTGTRRNEMTIEAGTCRVGPAGLSPPRLMLGFELPNFLRFVAGQFDVMTGFLAGQLRLSGDVVFAQRVEQWFGEVPAKS